jgi:hypothetical protein
MEDLLNMRCWFVSRARYTYRGEVVRFEGSLAVLRNNAKVIDLGDGTQAPREEIRLPDGWRVDLRECEAFGPEPASWGWKKK